MNRYKPVGWKNESHRHYLAAKGIKTRYNASKNLHKYMAYQVGNTRDSSNLQRLHALQWTDSEILANKDSLVQGINPYDGTPLLNKQGLPLLNDSDITILQNKQSDKQTLSDQLPPPVSSGVDNIAFGSNPVLGGQPLQEASFGDEQFTDVPTATVFPSNDDFPKELPSARETEELDYQQQASSFQNPFLTPIPPQNLTEPAPLTAERRKLVTPEVGLPENLLI